MYSNEYKIKRIVLIPTGGLANRIRVIESAYNYALEFSAKLIIIWKLDETLNAKFGDCFVKIPDVKIIDLDYSGRNLTGKMKLRIFNFLIGLYSFLFVDDVLNDFDIESIWQRKKNNLRPLFNEMALNKKVLLLKFCYDFYPNDLEFRIEINSSIIMKAEKIILRGRSYIGIHIRRTDNINSISFSPLESFIKKITDILTINPDTYFYLSTDSNEVVDLLKGKFNDSIIVGIKERSRNSKEGIMAALLDLCCLSRCNEIFGSFDSSFSTQAAKMGDIPLYIIN